MASYTTLKRARELLEQHGYVRDPIKAHYIKPFIYGASVITDSEFYLDPIAAIKSAGINFIWTDDDVTEVISRDDWNKAIKDGFSNQVTKCQHKWATYTGLKEVETFCEKCKEVQK